MSLCFIEPHDAIVAIAESVGREARRQLVAELIQAWIDELPEMELGYEYERALSDLDEHDLSLLAAWHASFDLGQPLPSREFLVGVFPSLGECKREALKIAVGFRDEEAFETGQTDQHAFEHVLPRLSSQRATEVLDEATVLYCWDRLGSPN